MMSARSPRQKRQLRNVMALLHEAVKVGATISCTCARVHSTK
uniref:Uncharacterized protein n=1 Tax=Arundo donax TaxID=35708 RepID=A0A0A9B9S1_ARUDO